MQAIPLQVLGKAAALSGGKAADGRIDLGELSTDGSKNVVLAQHSAYCLTSPTLEPVARAGDVLLVKNAGEPSVKSLVVALSDDRILARRFEVAENHSDVAVLTAQAINPRKIAPPVVAHKATFALHKIVGVLYAQQSWSTPSHTGMEVRACNGESEVKALMSGAEGLVEVAGESAEPYALNGQYLIIKSKVIGGEALKLLDGRPVIAADTDDNRYFKRLRVSADRVVLESLDSSGDHVPIVLMPPGSSGNCLESVWPVVGVLFELPS